MSSAESIVAPSILDLVNKTCELPTLPDVLVKLNEVMANPESSAEDVAQVISLDPPVATNILRIVNSAYYGLQVRVSSVNLAVSIMGFNMTRKVALKAAVFSQFASENAASRHFEPRAFWRHSIYTGVLARVLAQASGRYSQIHPEDVYISGLLHDIGTIILLQNCPESLEGVLSTAVAEQRSAFEVEQEQLGYTHADVGSVLAIKWFLPEELTIAVRYHESPEKDPFQNTLSGLIALADRLAAGNGHPGMAGVPTPEPTDDLFERTGVDREQLDELLDKASQDFAASEMPF